MFLAVEMTAPDAEVVREAEEVKEAEPVEDMHRAEVEVDKEVGDTHSNSRNAEEAVEAVVDTKYPVVMEVTRFKHQQELSLYQRHHRHLKNPIKEVLRNQCQRRPNSRHNLRLPNSRWLHHREATTRQEVEEERHNRLGQRGKGRHRNTRRAKERRRHHKLAVEKQRQLRKQQHPHRHPHHLHQKRQHPPLRLQPERTTRVRKLLEAVRHKKQRHHHQNQPQLRLSQRRHQPRRNQLRPLLPPNQHQWLLLPSKEAPNSKLELHPHQNKRLRQLHQQPDTEANKRRQRKYKRAVTRGQHHLQPRTWQLTPNATMKI